MGPQRKRLLLSKNLLEMKFMKRTKEKTEKELEDEERQATFANEITSAMLSHGSKFLMESSYAACEKLTFGRMSFKGANPEIEKIMRRFISPQPPKEDSLLQNEKYADVTATEVAQTLSLTKTISRKFSKQSLKRGFKRPAED
ncbi:M-phase phosphoprotein 6-like [Daphnia carinata]|uniref:M-phase phosphoprotein 6-like n=1 Tax=Daphnia carinata TaxID=120202 RepID=UPI00257C95CE|nr:M-phase phosphoprotein 6-like [Daphnia carinata]